MALVVTAMTSAMLGSFCRTGRKEESGDSREGACGGGVSRGTNQTGRVGCWRCHPCVTVPHAKGTTPSLHLQATNDEAGSCETLIYLISVTCSKDSSHRGDCFIIDLFVGTAQPQLPVSAGFLWTYWWYHPSFMSVLDS